jgi:hypothetical protein
MKSKARAARREAFKLSTFDNPSGQIVWRASGTKKDGSRVRQNFKTELEAIGKKQRPPRSGAFLPASPQGVRFMTMKFTAAGLNLADFKTLKSFLVNATL